MVGQQVDLCSWELQNLLHSEIIANKLCCCKLQMPLPPPLEYYNWKPELHCTACLASLVVHSVFFFVSGHLISREYTYMHALKLGRKMSLLILAIWTNISAYHACNTRALIKPNRAFMLLYSFSPQVTKPMHTAYGCREQKSTRQILSPLFLTRCFGYQSI